MKNINGLKPIDRSAVKLCSPCEVAYWIRKLGLSRAELFEAVGAAGHDIQAVRGHIHCERLACPAPQERRDICHGAWV